jgi:hypothetical protein
MFTPETIKERVQRQPFVPLRIVTSSGGAYEVRHPDLIMIGRRELIIGLASKKKPGFYKELARVALMHVTAMEDIRAASKPKGNGQQ